MKTTPGCFTATKTKIVTTALLILFALAGYGKSSSPFEVKTVFFNSFEVKAVKNTLEFSWVVTEYNNKSFVLQHSVNGNDWEDIALIDSKKSLESLEGYSYKYASPAEGKHYYRIMHTNIDGLSTGYSAVRIIAIKNETSPLSISPNPATNEIHIAGNTKNAVSFSKVTIYDLSGKIMIEKELRYGNNTIIVDKLPSGVYVVNVENENGEKSSQKLIKQ